MRHFSVLWPFVLLSADSFDGVEVPLHKDGVELVFRVRQGGDPYFAASVFCNQHDLIASIEGNECTTLMAEEVRRYSHASYISRSLKINLIVSPRPS